MTAITQLPITGHQKSDDYDAFLESKVEHTALKGIDIPNGLGLHPQLKDFQEFVVRTALSKGRFGIYEECGFGKAFQLLEIGSIMSIHTNKPSLALAPFAVTGQLLKEAEKFGYEAEFYKPENLNSQWKPIQILNYDQAKKLTASEIARFGCVLLDESSILKNFTGKTKQLLIEKFKTVPFRYCFSATPSPNDLLELLNQADFLGIMKTGEAIARWFQVDTQTAGKYTLKRHAAKSFWQWVASWSIFLDKPSDLGFSDDGYELPKLHIIQHTIAKQVETLTDLGSKGKVNATGLHADIRATEDERLKIVGEIVNGSSDQFIVWALQNDESRKLANMLNGAREVYGSQKETDKLNNLLGFADNEFRVLVTKAKIAGMGMNYQNCAHMVFSALDFSYEAFYQAIRRCYRFGQEREVYCHIITPESQGNVIEAIEAKQALHNESKAQVKQYMRKIHMENKALLQVSDYVPKHQKGANWTSYYGDNVQEIDQIEDESIGLVVTSIPFESLYIYSGNLRDMGNNNSPEAFQRNLQFLTDKLYRKMMPGRVVAVHVKDMPAYSNKHGYNGLRPFSDITTQTFLKSGFVFGGRITIVTDQVMERAKNNNQRLLHLQTIKDRTISGVGTPEYILKFIKWEPNRDLRTPVTGASKTHSFEEFSGNVLDAQSHWFTTCQKHPNIHTFYNTHPNDGNDNGLTLDEAKHIYYNPYEYSDKQVKAAAKRLRGYSIECWQRMASPVWFDIVRTDVLKSKTINNEQVKHICPLQLETIKRCIHLWSNEGDMVLDPFGGIGSTGFKALQMNRKATLIELNDKYWQLNCQNLRNADGLNAQLTLF